MTPTWTARRVALAPPVEEPQPFERLAARRGFPGPSSPERLGALVRSLSSAYNTLGSSQPSHLAARLGFSFARDVPKAGAAVAELVLAGKLSLDRPLRVLDVGAGLGATTWGVARALSAAGCSGTIDATMAEPDELARRLGEELGRELGAWTPRVAVAMRWVHHDFAALPHGPFDLVLLGQVLSELSSPGVERTSWLTARLAGLLADDVSEDGSLVVVEPALRARSRQLHAVRDALADRVFAPCTRAGPCPMLARASDWCHEDLAVDLPPWLVPTARAAGLRREGLSFSYLVLRNDGARVPGTHRLVGRPLHTKGKTELDLCGSEGLVRIARLDRDRSEPNALVDELERGELLSLTPTARISRTTEVRSG